MPHVTCSQGIEAMRAWKRLFAVATAIAGAAIVTHAARAEGVADQFKAHAKGSTVTVDHGAWTALLEAHVVAGRDGLNRVAYATWKKAGHAELKGLCRRARGDRRRQARIGRSSSRSGPTSITPRRSTSCSTSTPSRRSRTSASAAACLPASQAVPGRPKSSRSAASDLSLDDIEHGILRAVFKDPRVHYAVNCASVGCPNLGREAFTGAKLEAPARCGGQALRQLCPAASRSRMASVTASSIYDWFQADFGGSARGCARPCSPYAEPALKQSSKASPTIADFAYDWTLNDAKELIASAEACASHPMRRARRNQQDQVA